MLLTLLVSGTCVAQAVQMQLMPKRMQAARKQEQRALIANDSLQLAEAWYLYGKAYVLAGKSQTAQAYFLRALRVHEPRGDSPELSRLYVRLSETEALLGRTDRSLKLAIRALTIAERTQSRLALIRANDALGSAYEKFWGSQVVHHPAKQKHIEALYRKAEQLCYQSRDTMGVADLTLKLGTFFAKLNDPQAIPYLEKAVLLYSPAEKSGNKIAAMTQLASAYLTVHRAEVAFRVLGEAEQLYTGRQVDDYTLRLMLEKQYVLYYQATKQWQKALTYLEKLHELEKNLLMADNEGAISRLNIEYETEKREAQLRAQNSELLTLRLQQRFAVVAGGLLLITAILSVVFFRLYRKNQRTSRQNEELVKEQNHRVKNNLQVISSLLSLQSNRLTDETARRAIDESRLRVQSMSILHQHLYDGHQLATVELDEFIREVVSGVLRAYGYPTMQPHINIDTVTLPADKAVPIGLIINELATNACKYAFPGSNVPELAITCRRQRNQLTLTVADNGPGLNQTAESDRQTTLPGQSDAAVSTYAPTGKSFGMRLIQAQAEQLGGTYLFQLGGVGKGTTFILTITV